jgi:SanA protein
MKKVITIGLWTVLSVAVLIIGINVGIYLSADAFMYDSVEDVPEAEVVLIPGAAVLKDGTLSPIFRNRVDTAIRVYKSEKVSKILVSGDNSTATYNEVNPVRLYLLEKGIPDEDIFLDYAGFDTYSTMYRASYIFGVNSVIITTQSFHLPRSVFLARAFGIQAYGLNADVGHILLRNYVREIFANEKAIFELLIHRVPKFLGEQIPITGDGRLAP